MMDFGLKFLKKVYFTFVDEYAFDRQRNPLWERVLLTFRHKMAAKGIFLSSNEKSFAKLKDIHKGERCVIIGNGPSLNELDLSRIKNEFTFGVNAIYLNYDKMGFYPTYYVVEDNFVAEDRADEINRFKGSKFKFFGNYFRRTLQGDEKTIFINVLRNYKDTKNFPLFSKNCVRELGVGGSVTYLCLQIAYHMGFSEVYMIGFDHNYKIPESALVSNKRETGFDILSTDDDVNHFSKDYFGKGYRWHDPNVDRMEVGFRKAKEAYESDGRKVFNATKGGKLEVFPRVKYEDVFK